MYYLVIINYVSFYYLKKKDSAERRKSRELVFLKNKVTTSLRVGGNLRGIVLELTSDGLRGQLSLIGVFDWVTCDFFLYFENYIFAMSHGKLFSTLHKYLQSIAYHVTFSEWLDCLF